MKSEPFSKAERISIQREIDRLFNEGSAFTVYPLRVFYLETKPLSGVSASILISVPKKRFKRAVQRNRIKRLVRETYRKNKHSLLASLQTQDTGLLLAFVYVSNHLCSYSEMETAIKKSLQILLKKLP
ncbi:MAG: Ribonuclease P protein component [Candidatus Ordinivivax streblomastigis]|uniref:Ribonuclease P protein component n=1 Tax=Candidatus Ordinivivax streblomastigis TaxID=2540710 RepID=A0A5M8NWG5_9BACT|nr:MAG: Ribonuclease P protein component [Candidatus Ordinivivax streblomastigis]